METIKQLIAALREELQQYGEMLARLDEQQDCVLRRAADDLLRTVDEVQNQGVVLAEHRRAREQQQQATALQLGLAADAPLKDIIPLLPDVYRPLVHALMQENNDLLVRVQQRARQNHLLLTRSMELMQNLLGSLVPANNGAAYGQNGNAYARPVGGRALYEAVG
ncbi:MAG TPA: flagellar export chaperone FlgN [Verrucomicrobiae bacterium]